MKTKQIPIIITLLAAGITCLVSAIQDVSFSVYTKRLFIAVICFALIGTGIKVLLDRSFRVMEEDTEDSESGAAEDDSADSEDKTDQEEE